MTNDLQIINQVLHGKKDYYSILMDKYYNEMFSFIFNMLGNYDDTEDLLQEIFLKIYKNLSKYNHNKSAFRTWMYRVASNHAINYINKNRNIYKEEFQDYKAQSPEDIEEETIKEQQIKEIVTTMKKVLSKKHQEILILHYFSGLTVKEISIALGIPDKTVYKALKTSIEKIKKEVTTND